MGRRSQPRKRQLYGKDSRGYYFGGPITGIAPGTASIANAGAVARTVATMTASGGKAPYTWAVTANTGGLGVAMSANLLQTTTNPVRAAGTGAFPVQLTVTDANKQTTTFTITVTLT